MRRGTTYKNHKKLIKIMQEFNKQVREDTQFQGRFYIREVQHQYQMYGDLSGYSYCYVFEFVDKVTGKRKDAYIRGCCGKWCPNDRYEIHQYSLTSFKYHLFEAFNNFIVDYVGA